MKLNLSAGFALDVEAAAGDAAPRRQISGIAVPYNTPAVVSDGTEVMFAADSLPSGGKAPKLFMYHDATQPIGVVTARQNTPEGMLFTATVVDTQAGTDALTMAAAGVLDAVSVGVNATDFYYNSEGTMVITAADWLELSLVPIPAFAGATITDVAASADIHQNPDDVSNNPEDTVIEENNEMSEPVTVEASKPESVVPTAPVFAEPKREFKMPSAAEYLAAMHIGGDTFRKVNAAFHEAARANQTAIQAAAGDVATTDTPGLLPVPVLGPLVQNLNFIRPVVTALGARPMPNNSASKTFIRPTITTHTSAAAQANENTAVSATTMVIASNVVTKSTIAGQVTLSVQDVDFTDPAALQLILNDLMGEYLIATDNLACTNLLAGATTSGVWDGTLANLMVKIYTAAYDISNTTNFFPTHMFVSPDVWSQLGQLVDTTNRPVFPAIGSSLGGYNTLGAGDATSWSGMNPLGLQLVVDKGFAAKTMIITKAGTGVGDAFE